MHFLYWYLWMLHLIFFKIMMSFILTVFPEDVSLGFTDGEEGELLLTDQGDWSASPLPLAVRSCFHQASDSPCINCTAIILGSLSFLLMSPVWFPFWPAQLSNRDGFCDFLVNVVHYFQCCLLPSVAGGFSESDLETFMSCVFSQGLVLLALSVGEIAFANQRKFTERVAVLLLEIVFSSSMHLSPVTSLCLDWGGKSLSVPDLSKSHVDGAGGRNPSAP